MIRLQARTRERRAAALTAKLGRAALAPSEILTVVIAILAAASAAAGVFTDLYRDNDWTRAANQGNDGLTLLIVPALLASMLAARRGSLRARLVWLGLLGYMLYGYGFYLFGARFNEALLCYAAIVSLSAFTLGVLLAELDATAVAQRFAASTPVRGISTYMLVLALGLAAAWTAQSLAFVASGELPGIVRDTGHPTSVVFALDLTIVVPTLLVGAVLLRARRPWGYVLAPVLMVKGVTYALALIAMAAGQAAADIPHAWAFAPFSIVFVMGGGICSWLLLVNVGPSRAPSPVRGCGESAEDLVLSADGRSALSG